MAAIKNSNQNYIFHADKSWAAITVTNNKIDAVLIKQLSNPDSVLIELKYNTRFFAASMYFDITKEIERELNKMDEILEFTKGNGLLIAVVSNSRSTAWHDSQNN
jgi:dihydroxyacetone kinase-like predicted kinase